MVNRFLMNMACLATGKVFCYGGFVLWKWIWNFGFGISDLGSFWTVNRECGVLAELARPHLAGGVS